ncbi:MAG TPA: FadR/GntR family transcriptional regulator [Bauldia sp.]|nr:FadR/GntR family transcriptional regulator [Bauldia sp.]
MKANDGAQTATLEFGQQVARSTRLSDKVADAMLDTILRLGLKPGAALPSERELSEQYGVSRTVIREAVRALMSRGLVDARAGRGLTVSQVAADAVSMSMRLYLHGRDEIPYTKIHEVRAGIETDIAGYAAERATNEEIAELARMTEQMRSEGVSLEEHSQMDVEFHRAVARMTHNELYLIMLDSIGPVLLEIRRATFDLPDDRRKAYEAHKHILDAIAARDANGAREAMRLHLEQAKRDWLSLGLVHLKTI